MSIKDRGTWNQIAFASNSINFSSLPELLPAHSITFGVSEDGSPNTIPPNIKATRSPNPQTVVDNVNANEDEDDRGSVYSSIHERETDECRDTSDTEGESSASEIMEVVEYEVASTSESDNFFANTSSSGTDDGFIILANLTTTSDSSSTMGDCDIEFFADTESDDSSMASDPELSRADYWECVKCRNKKNNPMYSFCQVCFQKRKSLYPPPPTRKRSRSEFRDNRLKRQLSQLSEKNSISKRPRSGTPDSNSSISLTSPSKRSYFTKAGNNTSMQSTKNQQKNKRSNGESTDSDSNSDHDLGNALKSSLARNRIGFLNKRSPRRQFSSVDSQPSTSSTGVSMFNNSSHSNDHDNSEPVTTVGELTLVVSGASSTATNSTNNQNFQSSLSLGVTSHSRKREASYERETTEKRMKLDLEIRSAVIVDQQNAPECSNISSSIISGKLNNKFLQNVACTSAPSDADSSDSGQPTKSLPESTTSSKDSGFSSCSLQELNSQTFDSQETYCSEIAIPVKPSGSGMLEQIMNPNVFLASSLTRNASSMSDTQYTVLDSQNSQLSQASSSASTSDTTNLGTCIICLTNIKDGVFVHKSKVHLCCCYKCAKQIWRQRKRCPVCNGKVTTVAKLFAS